MSVWAWDPARMQGPNWEGYREPAVFYADYDTDSDDAATVDVLERLRAHQQGIRARAPYLDASVPGPLPLRDVLRMNCELRTGGVVPRDFQLDVAEAIHAGRDVVLQAFTGAGKTLAMVILLFTFPDKFVIIASPLNVLEDDMVSALRKWGLVAYAYNSEVRTPELDKAIRQRKFQVLATSPERLTDPGGLRPHLTNPDWSGDCLALDCDEAHLIIDWGISGFRPAFAKLSLLRSFFDGVPIVCVSATLSPASIQILSNCLHMRPNCLHLNLGNVRDNIFYEVRVVPAGKKTATPYLRFLLPTKTTHENVRAIPSTIVFVPDRASAGRVAHALRQHLPDSLQLETVIPLHAKSRQRHRDRTLELFDSGRARILVSTTLTGLGRDFRSVTRIVIYMLPENLESLVQEAGRGARAPHMKCHTTVLVPQSAMVKRRAAAVDSSSSDSDAEDMDSAAVSFATAMEHIQTDAYVTKMTPHLRAFVAPLDSFGPQDLCRCQILAGYFDNPAVMTQLCDVCRSRHDPGSPALSTMPPFIPDLTLPSDARPRADTQPAVKPRAPPSRIGARYEAALTELQRWRLVHWGVFWQDTNARLTDVVADSVLEAIARCPTIYTLEDLARIVPRATMQRFGEELLDVVLEVKGVEAAAQEAARAERDRGKQELLDAKEAERARKLAEKEEERTRKLAEKEAERSRKLAEKEAERARKLAEKAQAAEERARKAVEKQLEKDRKAEAKVRLPAARSNKQAAQTTPTTRITRSSAVKLESPASPPQSTAVLAERTNSPPKAGPSRIPLDAPLPSFNLPNLSASRPPPSLLALNIPSDLFPSAPFNRGSAARLPTPYPYAAALLPPFTPKPPPDA